MDIPIYIKNSTDKIEGDAKVWIDKFLYELSNNANIIEIGSGTGRDANYFEEREYKVTRTDIHQEFIEYQNKKYKKEVLIFDVEKDFIPDNFLYKFDGLFVRAVLNHFSLEKTEEILKRLKKVLKPHGVLAFNLSKDGFSQKIIDYFKREDFKVISIYTSKKDIWVYIIISYNK